jgi:hypothetical protein
VPGARLGTGSRARLGTGSREGPRATRPVRHSEAMTGAVLVISGVFAIVYGSWRGCVAARQAILPLVREGDETRTLMGVEVGA